MAFDVNKPADNQTIAAGPADIRENLRALKEDKIVNAQKVMDLSPGNASGDIPKNNGTVNTNLNADMLDGQHGSYYSPTTHTHAAATTSSNGLMSNTDKAKLDGIYSGAEVNQYAFSNVSVGGTTVAADSKTDTLELVAGTNISLTPDTTNDRVTIAVSGTVSNADTVDSKHASDFPQNLVAANEVDLNTLTTCGVYRLSSAPVNGPSGVSVAWGQMLVLHASGDTIAQVVIQYDTGRMFIRAGNPTVIGGTGTWNDWREIAAIDGNIATATKLQTARTINGVSFDGSSNITITAAANGGTSAVCSGNAATATKLQTARSISLTGDVTGAATFDGSANLAITTAVPNLVSHGKKIFSSNGTFYVPDKVTEVWVTMTGGGGGNGYYHGYEYEYPSYVDHYYSYTGGRGASCYMRNVPVTPGTSIAVTVGTAGKNGTAAASLASKVGSDGTAGGASSFGSLLTCSGGGAAKGTTATNGTTPSPQEISLSWGSAATSGVVIVEW